MSKIKKIKEDIAPKQVKPPKEAKQPKPTKPVKRRATRLQKIVFFSIAGGLLLIISAATDYAFYYSPRILPHTKISGVDVGGLTEFEANAKLQEKETAFLKNQLTLVYGDKNWKIAVADLLPTFSNEAAVHAAYAVGKAGSIGNEFKDLSLAVVRERTFDVDFAPISSAAHAKLSTVALSSIETPVKETTLSFAPGNVQVVNGTAGRELVMDDFQTKFYQAFVTGNAQVVLTLGVAQPQVTADNASAARDLATSILSTNWTVQSGTQQLTIKPQDMAGWLVTSVVKDPGTGVPRLSLALNPAPVDTSLTAFAKSVNVAPTDAVVIPVSDGLTVSLSDKPGVELEIDPTFQSLSNAILANSSDHVIPASTKTIPAAVPASASTALTLIGTAKTDYSGSSSSRTANIKVGTAKLNGVVVQPGDTFSTIANLVPIDQAHGYVPGLVILGNTTVPADGGGLCQVSTTLFRAVLNAGLPITERQNHSYEVSFYQRGGIGPGLDATIYDPHPDFRWKNDTGHPVYVQSSIVGTVLTFNLFGVPDGRVASVVGPTTLETYPALTDPIYTQTDTLAPGQIRMTDGPVPGAKTTASYTVTRNGEVINSQVFNSYYKPMPAQYLIGATPQ